MAVVVLFGALALTLCIGVGWRERSRWTPTIERRLFRRRLALEARMAAAEQTCRRLSASLDTLFQRSEATTDALFAHECKPSTVAHGKPPAKKAAPVKAAAKKAPAKKATPRRSVR